MAYGALYDPALSSPLLSYTVAFPPDALDFLLLLQQEQPVSTPGPLHMLSPCLALSFIPSSVAPRRDHF